VPPGGKLVRIDLDPVNLGKWRTLNPVYSYCHSLDDLTAFESDEGKAAPRSARNGALLPDTSGQSWHYVPDVWAEGKRRLCFVPRFEHDAYVAMRVPYTPSYNQKYLASLAGNPYAQVITIGRSPQGRPLQVVKISNGPEAERANPCVFLCAGEQPDEPDASWAVQGALRFLVSDDSDAASLRQRYTFLLLPVYDPDGAAAGVFQRISYRFMPQNPPPEVVAYANWFERWVDGGKRLDVALTLYNMESAEMPHLGCFYADGNRAGASRAIHAAIVRRLGDPFRIEPTVGKGDFMSTRLCGFLGYYYGPVCMLYELNSQEKTRHLSLLELREIGRGMALACADYLGSDAAGTTLSGIDFLRRGRAARLAKVQRGANAIDTAWRLNWDTMAAANEQRASAAAAAAANGAPVAVPAKPVP
jgi:hypothetical protein